MRRLLVVAACCASTCARRCGGGSSEPPLPIAKDTVQATASKDAANDASTPPTLPIEWTGTYAIAGSAEKGPPFALRLYAVGPKGSGAPHELAVSTKDPIEAIAISPDGAAVAYTTVQSPNDPTKNETLFAVGSDGASPRVIAKCGYECQLAGFGVDGEVWYVDRSSSSLVGDLHHVSSKGGASVAWPHGFADCMIFGNVSDDGRALLLAVDNSLGWPECIDGGYQGFYVIPIGDAALRNKKPRRIDCFTTRKATEINLQIESAEFDGPDRILFTLTDGWDDPDAAIPPLTPWSCKRDGTDPQRPTTSRPHVDVAPIDGHDWLVLSTTPADVDSGQAPIPILGPLDSGLGAYAHRPPR